MSRHNHNNAPMTLVIRGNKDALQSLRKELRIIAIRKDVTLSSLILSILLNYVAAQTTTDQSTNESADHA